MKVVYVSPHADLGGAERTMMDLVALHDRRLVEPSLVFLSQGPLVEAARALGVPAEVLPAPRLRQVAAARALRRSLAAHLRARGADLVHAVMAWGHVYAGWAARSAGVPAVWFQQNVPEWRNWLDVWAAYTPAARVLANSRFTASHQRRMRPWARNVEVVHLGVRLPDDDREVRRARGRLALGMGEGEFAVGIAARLQRWKGQDVVLRAFASLARRRPGSRLFVIGGPLFGIEPDYPGVLRGLAEDLGIAGRVVFTGHRTDIPDCLAALDVAVHASVRPEPFGLALVEAMAAGTPLVAADAGAIREIVSPGADGLVTPPGDAEALAAVLLALHDDPARRASLAAAGLETVRARFDARIMTSRVEDVYRNILGA